MKKNTKPQKQEQKPAPANKEKKKSFSIAVVGKQLLVALLVFILVSQAKEYVGGYQWVVDDLLKGNMETIKQYPDLSTEERYQLKMGFSILYLKHIKDNTPDSAIILFPNYETFLDTKDVNQDLSGMSGWCSTKYGYYRFLHPRKVVFEKEKETSPFYPKITHVAIINGWGYEYLDYPVAGKVLNTVMPKQLKQQ